MTGYSKYMTENDRPPTLTVPQHDALQAIARIRAGTHPARADTLRALLRKGLITPDLHRTPLGDHTARCCAATAAAPRPPAGPSRYEQAIAEIPDHVLYAETHYAP